MQQKQLSLTVGLTTCYGDPSIVETIRSIRASKGIDKFPIILVADRVPIRREIKQTLRKLRVQLIENKTEGSQVKKQKQILKLTKTDLLVFTQDDVLLHPKALVTVIRQFAKHPQTTMISILNKPVKATSLFESIISVGTEIANKYARYWHGGDNYLSVIGRFMAFRTEKIKCEFRLQEQIATSDTYYYFENKRTGGRYEYLPGVCVYFKNPQNMKEHLRKSSRFQFSKQEMSKYFADPSREYVVPVRVIVRSLIEQFLRQPPMTLIYFGIFAYTRLMKMAPQSVLNPIWEVDLSTKKVLAHK